MTNNKKNNIPAVVELEMIRFKRKFSKFGTGYVKCARCGKPVDDGGFFKNTNAWGCFDCLES